ncbi:MAG: hypothetical protein QOD74_1912, partial [Variibacter sp.]|nr:hypothetical protein [Variibacter sp.]
MRSVSKDGGPPSPLETHRYAILLRERAMVSRFRKNIPAAPSENVRYR